MDVRIWALSADPAFPEKEGRLRQLASPGQGSRPNETIPEICSDWLFPKQSNDDGEMGKRYVAKVLSSDEMCRSSHWYARPTRHYVRCDRSGKLHSPA